MKRPWRFRRAGYLIVLLSIAITNSPFSYGPAQASPLLAPMISLDPASGYAGSTTQVYGSGWTSSPNATPYEIHGGSKTGPLLATFAPNPNGAFSVQITIPSSAAPGDYLIWVCERCTEGMGKTVWVSASFKVKVRPTATLPPPPPPRPTPTPTREPTECDRTGLAGEFVIDFEEQPAGTRLDGTTLSPGIRFMGDDALVVFHPSVLAHSGSQALMNDFAGREFGSINIPIRIGFENLADFVGVFVGLNEQIWADEPFTATLTAYGLDDDGRRVVVGTDSDTLGPEATPIEVCLAVEAPGRIFEVTINYSGEGGVAESEIIDDLVIRGPEEPVPVPEDELPPIVEILEPTDGFRVTETRVRLDGRIIEDRELARVEVWVNGSLYREIGFSSAGESNYLFALDAIPGTSLMTCEENEIEVRAFDVAGNEGMDQVGVIYDPMGDLRIISAAPVQVVYNSLLVKNKSTAFRVRVESTFVCETEIDVLLELPEDEWSTAPPRSGRYHTGVPTSWEYPDTWGPYTIPGGVSDYEIMLPRVAPGEEDVGFDLSLHPAGMIHNREAGGVFGPDIRVVPRPIAVFASFRVMLDPENLLAETNEGNNEFTPPSREVVSTRKWDILFVPYYAEDLDCGAPVVSGIEGAVGTQIEYLLATFPIADTKLSYAIAPILDSEACEGTETCGWNTVWESGLGRGGFLDRIARMAELDGYDFAVGLDCGGAGGAIGGFDKAVAIGEWAGMAVLAHEFNHAVVGIDDIYSLDCLAGWDEAYCEYADGSREYCCFVDGWAHRDGTTELNCSYDAAGEVVCEEQTKRCIGECDCSLYRLDPPPGETDACLEMIGEDTYSIPSCDATCCANVCRGLCPGAEVHTGPDGRINHPASEGFWVNRWIPAGEGNNYFMDIPSAGAFPGFWMRLETSSNHCEGYSFSDGMRAMLRSPKFRSSVDPEALLVSGTIHQAGTASFYPFYYLPEANLDLEPGSPGEYSLVLLGGAGEELARFGFSVIFAHTDPNGGPVEQVPFVHRIAWMEGTRRIELRDSTGSVMAAREVSDNAPQVRVLEPDGGEIWAKDKSYEIRWQGTDEDGDDLTYALSLSADAGETWIPVAIDLTATEFKVDLAEFPLGATYLIKVRATDGVHTAEDVSNQVFSIQSEEAVPTRFVYIAGLAVVGIFAIAMIVAGFVLARRQRRSTGGR